MVSFSRRLTSVAMVFALSGSPGVLAACMAPCLQGVATASSREGSTPTGHAAHTPVPAGADASVHAHHGAPASNESAANATNSASSHEWSDPRLSAVCSDCCADGQFARVAGAGVERADALRLGAGPATQVASFLLTASALGASPPSPPVPPPSPTRAPLVLRI